MSDLPKSVGIAHRSAHRHNNKRLSQIEANMEPEIGKESVIKPARKGSSKRSPKAESRQGEPVQVERPGQGLKQIDKVAFNHEAEIQAVQYLVEYIGRKGPPTVITARCLIALEFDISTATAERYLQKYSVDHPKARFEIRSGFVQLRGDRA
jgi:hypothetical protein